MSAVVRRCESRRVTVRQATGVVLAAGSSSRLGAPKQLLPYRDTTLLGATLDMARGCDFGQLIVTLGGAAPAVRDAVLLAGIDVVVVEEVGDDVVDGCSASLRVALERVHRDAAGIVLMLGDQPGIDAALVRRLLTEASGSPVAVCRYQDGVGHPFWLSRAVFGELAQLHGDKGIWKLIESGSVGVYELAVDGTVPLDVDTWDDYRRLVESVPR
jgi:molybdenum cofactor cytidylyltransferase